ncbi:MULTISPECIES: transaldolase family protein [Acidiplasma]|jgi:transaldolase|uniref:Probable transaldolase n=2 Tax=Acidiplasma TaxID=507753 RepID=A0A0N8VKH7_9ARCH|nr:MULTISPECIES: transaldolase family protein [Acidiplasma]KJE50043.1 hypothetical protein TZ01_03020 [Acidiplasma sp. MBA-1]KPV46514.1 hypothetical protein SE19_05170 [Acidiplasma aeolicum]KQB33756.1 hypothetical protein AOG55_02025 [Acidiplasma cupricumulans]KQB36234.1 hypothetical protein AOG54_07740 [Acidiplasma aeolicum]WMT55256.1 MAG: transaldolase family protein [Acidiplasma sp.]
MKIFLDSANIDEINNIARYGILDGITTNPSILSKEVDDNNDTAGIINNIIKHVNGEVHIQVTSDEYDTILKQAMKIHSLGLNVIVKIPVTQNGMAAMASLRSRGIKINATTIFTPLQALAAAKNNAEYSTVYLSSIDDSGNSSYKVIQTIRTMFNNYNMKTKIMGAAIKNPVQIIECGMAGVDAVTAPYGVLKQMLDHPETLMNVNRFIKDWNLIPQNSKTFFNQ